MRRYIQISILLCTISLFYLSYKHTNELNGLERKNGTTNGATDPDSNSHVSFITSITTRIHAFTNLAKAISSRIGIEMSNIYSNRDNHVKEQVLKDIQDIVAKWECDTLTDDTQYDDTQYDDIQDDVNYYIGTINGDDVKKRNKGGQVEQG